MESINSVLENGEEYSVKQLLSTDHRKIIIPDFQRDYCWGNKNYGENNDTDIVSSFIQTLVEEQENGDIVLGKIDVYQNPKNHIHLTDGQQRLTTIYLLLGMLARKASSPKKEELKNCLISEYEKNDDKEPYLQYSIRESSLFFLRDLVNDFFIKENNYSVKDLEKQPWYFKEYDLDPTIQSMLRALTAIETEINKIKEIDVFSSFVLNNIKIQYYDVVDRKHGEERFVIINTTGKQLSVSENIKPILLGKIKDTTFATKWEKRETHFWKNRSKEKKEFTSDKGVADFMIWCFQIIRKQEDIDLVKISKETLKNNDETAVLNRIDTLFGALEKLETLLKNKEIQKQFKFVNNNKEVKNCNDLRGLTKEETTNILLPILYFIEKISDDINDINQFVRRLRKNYFDNKRKERNSNYLHWRYVLQIIEKSKSLESCLTFKNENFEKIGILDIPASDWYNAEEQLKAELKKENQQLIEEIEDHQDFMGDLSFIFQVFLKKHQGIKNEFSILNEDLSNIRLSISNIEYLKAIKIVDIEFCFNLYKKLISNKLLSALEIRFNRHNHLWSGSWSLSREKFQYRRWHKKDTELIYQNWFYFIMGELLNNDVVIESLIKEYLKNIFSQSSKKFFETDLCFDKTIDIEQFYVNLNAKYDSENNNGFYHWNGFLWYYLLAINEPEKNIEFEIVFDLFDRENNSFKLGNQFVWSKGYYDRTIITYDSFGDVNWNEWKKIEEKEPQVKEDFINKREQNIKELFAKSLE